MIRFHWLARAEKQKEKYHYWYLCQITTYHIHCRCNILMKCQKNTFCAWKKCTCQQNCGMYFNIDVCVICINFSLNPWMQTQSPMEGWKSVFFGNFVILSPFPHPYPAFLKQPESCQLDHNFYLLHDDHRHQLVERAYLDISRVIIFCKFSIPTIPVFFSRSTAY